MTRTVSFFITLILSATLFSTVTVAQERTQGVSLHMLPKRVAEIGGIHGGLFIKIYGEVSSVCDPDGSRSTFVLSRAGGWSSGEWHLDRDNASRRIFTIRDDAFGASQVHVPEREDPAFYLPRLPTAKWMVSFRPVMCWAEPGGGAD